MAITIVTQPQSITPCYNTNYVEVTSTNKNNDGFRYIAELFVDNVKVTAFKITPEFGTLNGKQNLSKLIASYLTTGITEDLIDGDVDSVNTINKANVLVKIQWGEEYNDSPWSFSDYLFAGSVAWSNWNNPAINPTGLSQTMLIGSTEPDYSAGDVIRVSQTAAPSASNYRVELEGNHLVLDVFTSGGDWYVVLDLPWIGSGAASPGTSLYSDGRKIIALNELETSTYRFINTALPFTDYNQWTATDYTLDGGTKKFLTSLPRGKAWRVRPDSLVLIQGFYPTIFTRVQFIQNNTVVDSYLLSNNNRLDLMDFSPRQLSALGDYEVQLGAGTDIATPRSEKLSFYIDEKCYGFADCEVVFMDRFGSFLPMQFQLRRSTNINVKREQYKKDVQDTAMYSQDVYDAGMEDLSIVVGKTYTLRSDRMSIEESELMEQLVSSPYTLVRFGTSDYQRCNVKTSSIDIKDEYFEGLRFYDIDIELTNKDVVNW